MARRVARACFRLIFQKETALADPSATGRGLPVRENVREVVKAFDRQAFRMENSLLRLIESLERKRDSGTWTETLIINESNIIYTSDNPDHP